MIAALLVLWRLLFYRPLILVGAVAHLLGGSTPAFHC